MRIGREAVFIWPLQCLQKRWFGAACEEASRVMIFAESNVVHVTFPRDLKNKN